MIDSWRETMGDRFQQHWLTVLLLGSVLISWLSVLAGSQTLREADPLAAMAVSGALYGALLAASRFRGRTALSIDVVTSLGLAVLVAGRLLPSVSTLFSQPLDKSLWLMNARLVTLSEVLRSDTQWVSTNYFTQTRLFFFLNMLLIWNAAAWLSWSVLRRRRALAAVLPLALLGALYTGLGKDGAQLPVLFIAACVLLLARTAYTHQTREWDRRNVGFPDLIGEDWAVWAAILSAGVVVLAGISTPEWRNSFQRFIESLRPPPPIETTTAPPKFKPLVYENYTPSFVPSLGYVGDSFPNSDQTVFYVATDDPPPIVDSHGIAQPPPRHYWRGAIFDRYTGSGWEPLNAEVEAPRPEATDLVGPGRYRLTQQFDILSLQDNHLFAANDPVKASAGISLQVSLADPTAVLARGRLPRYEITSWVSHATALELDADSTAYPQEIRERYLQLPDSVPQRVKDLAARLTQGATSAYDKALRMQDYLRATYAYRLDVPPPPPNQDVVDYFLFEAPGGFCSYFATAMTVMLRSQGVPARVATGFATGEYDAGLHKYRVPAKAAHAWVEVYFPTYGWIEFEPTSSQAVFDYANAEEAPIDQLPVAPQSRSTNTLFVPIAVGTLSVLVLSLIGVAALIVWRRYAESRLTPERQARKLYWEARRTLQPLGVGSTLSATPDEFRAACADRLADQPRLWQAVEAATDSYIRAVFTSTPPDRSDMERARHAWRTAWKERLRLRWRRLRWH